MPTPTRGAAHDEPRPDRFWAPVLVIAAAQLVMIMNNASINIALPRLSTDLGIDTAVRPWAVSTYLLTFGALLLIGGRAGDRWGNLTVFITGLAVVTAASCLGAAAQHGPTFIAARALLGIGAAAAAPSALALLSTTFPTGELRSRAFGIYGAVTGVGAAVGVLSGGLLTDLLSWRWAVLVSAPLAATAAFMAPRVLAKDDSENPGADRRSSLSPGSATLVATGVASVLLSLTFVEKGDPAVASLTFALATVLLTVFVVIQRSAANPLLDLHILMHPRRAIGLLAVGAGGLGATGTFVMLSVAMQEQMGLTPMGAAVATLPYPVGMVISSHLSTRIIDRFGLVPTVAGGLLGAAVGFIPLSFVGPHVPYAWLVLPGLVIAALMMGPMFVAGTRLTMSEVPSGSAGTMGAVMNSSAEITGAVGIGLLSAIAAGFGGHAYGVAIGCSAIVLALGSAIVFVVVLISRIRSGPRS